MKVLQINAVYGFKSTGVIVKDIADTLEQEGGDAYFAYQMSNQEVKNGFQVGKKLDWKWHALYARIFGKQAYASKRATRKFLKWVDKVSPDIVHFHNLHSNYVNLNMLCDYLAKRKIPVVITMHDCWYFTGKCSHYAAVKCEKWQTTCGNCPLNKSEQPSLFFDVTKKVLKDKTERLLKLKNLTLVGCSEWIANEARKSKLQTANIQVVYNGVDTLIFTPHESGIKKEFGIENDFIILGMADKWYAKQNREIVERLITSQDEKTKIVVVGCKDEQKTYFEGFANVIPLGYVTDRTRLSDIYAAADVFVNLTRADTLPTVNMESICCGTPVITFDCCGSPELVDEDCGYVVKEGDVEGLLAKLENVKRFPLQFDVAAKRKKFDKNECYKKYLDIYKSISENEK
ncbi:MAG: glycosyltransferase [Clostridia bacterium]|nr:glycosyltransferase [Clostridia bacterium]